MRIAHAHATTPGAAVEPPLALLVDYDDDSRRLFAESMKLGGWTVVEASDGPEALAKAIAERPDIIVTESQLPGIGGCDLCGELRRDPATRSIPIVVVTGDTSPQLVKRARDAGADVILAKPCSAERLLREATRFLARERDVKADEANGRPADAAAPAAAPGGHAERSSPRLTQSRAHHRRATITPPAAPPSVVCPACDRRLAHLRSHVGGVNARHQEQWDYFECPAGCGTFQYRMRTRKLKRVV